MLLCPHGRLWPCRSCDWRRRGRALARGALHVALCILGLALGAALYVAAHKACAHGYCGTCNSNGACPGGCACDPTTRLCIEI